MITNENFSDPDIEMYNSALKPALMTEPSSLSLQTLLHQVDFSVR